MMRRLLLLLFISAGSVRAAELVKAKITLKNKNTLEIEISSRDADGLLYVHETGKQMEIGLLPADIEKITFPIELDADKLDDLYNRAQYKDVVKLLAEPLQPTLPYCDLPTNIPGTTRAYLKSLCWVGQYQEVLDIAGTMARSSDPHLKQYGQLFRALAFVGLNRPADAEHELKSVGAVTGKDEVAPFYWYAEAQLQLARNDWIGAQETTARIVAFCGKELEWLLPGLYLSARCYAHEQQFEVVGQISREMLQMYPNSHWTAQAVALAAQTQDKGPKP